MHLRLQLLDASQSQHVALMKSLYGLLMLLPQSAAYKTLHNRLSAVSSMHSALGAAGHHSGGSGGGSGGSRYSDFTKQFVDIQRRHREARYRRQRAQSLLSASDEGAEN